jgi:anti-anti-sigma regulatory factor
MKVVLAPGWKTELDRGPDWLFVKLYGPDGDEADATGMAESLSMLLRQEFKRRMVLELDELAEMPQDLVEELTVLHETLEKQGALLRLCGMSKEHQDTLCENDSSALFNSFRDREEAVLGFYRPSKPR